MKTIIEFFKRRRKEILFVFLFYFFFSFLYNVVLWFNMSGFNDGAWSFFNLEGYWFRAGMRYMFFFFATFVVWFLGVYLLRSQNRKYQILTVILITPVVIYFMRELNYSIIDYLGRSRLRGTGTVWDWYIPLLFFYIQFGCYFAYTYFKENQEKIKLEAVLRETTLQSELSAIKAQLNPHFLYNVFNTINASVPAEQEKTRHLIAQLSDLFRYQLQASQSNTVPLKDELAFVSKYLDLEKERFGSRLQVSLNVSKDLYEEEVPPMLLQPLVENSIKHGLASLIEGGTIAVSIKREGERLFFEVRDTGIGIADKSEVFVKGIGLKNTQLRLQKKFNSELILENNIPQGLIAKFSIPCIK